MKWVCILCYVVFVIHLWSDIPESHCSQGGHREREDYRALSIGCMAFSFLGGIGYVSCCILHVESTDKFEMKTCAPHSRAFSHELGVQIFYFC